MHFFLSFHSLPPGEFGVQFDFQFYGGDMSRLKDNRKRMCFKIGTNQGKKRERPF